jgi:CTP synthase (UTP-ammonia lyase)
MPLISRLECSIAGQTRTVRITPGTTTARAYGREVAEEAFRCNFGLNPRYRAQILSGLLRVAGIDDDGEVRVVELGDHPFFVATLFLPQLSSTPATPHPLIVEFLRAAAAFRDSRRIRPPSGGLDTARDRTCG